MTTTKKIQLKLAIVVFVLGFVNHAAAQKLTTPGSFEFGGSSAVQLSEGTMVVNSASGTYEVVTAALLSRSLDFKQNKDLITVTLISDNGTEEVVVEKTVYVVRESMTNECGATVVKATPAKRLANPSVLVATLPYNSCKTDKIQAVVHRSMGMTGMIDGAIEMEGALASPF